MAKAATNGDKTKISLISKKATLHVQHTFFPVLCTFLCRFCSRLQLETTRNFLVTRFLEETSYVFLFTFFFLRRSFSPWWPLAFLTFSSPLQNFHVVLSLRASVWSKHKGEGGQAPPRAPHLDPPRSTF